MSYEISTPLRQHVLQKLRRDGELPSPHFHASDRMSDRIAPYRPARFGVCPNDVVRCHPESLSVAPIRGEHEEGL